MILRSFKRFLAATAVLVALCPGLLLAEVFGNFEYSVNNGSVIITGYAGAGVKVVIPSTIEGMPVTEIGDRAFYFSFDITSVTIPSSVTVIGDEAFNRCIKLRELSLPGGLTEIGVNVFSGCLNLTSVTLPEGFKEFGPGMFSGCRNLVTVVLPASVVSIGDEVFAGCNGLAEMNLPSGLQEIGDHTFVGCRKFAKINIPSGVKRIGNGAFTWCRNLESISIPGSVNELGVGAFENCEKLMQVSLSNGLVEIPERAFFGCESLKKVVIPASVERIGVSAFEGAGLNSIELGKSLRDIGERAFDNCEGLSRVTFPPKLRSVGKHAFAGCGNITSFIFTGRAPKEFSNIFSRITRINPEIAIYLDKGAKGFTVPRWKGFITHLASPEIAVKIEDKRYLADGEDRVKFPGVITATGSSVKRISIENLGNLKLKKLSAKITGANPWDYTVKNLTKGSVGPGKSAILEIEFVPRRKGLSHATLEIFSNDRDEGVFELELSGRGVVRVR